MAVPRNRRLRVGLLAAAAGASLCIGGCAAPSGIYDACALSQAKRLAVLPAVDAPGAEALGSGRAQTGVLINALANLNRFEVQGPGRLRKVLSSEESADPWSRQLQADLAKRLDIDLLVVSELADYRFTKQRKSSWFYVGSSHWTETTYHGGVSVRLVAPEDGRLVYTGRGTGKSRQGYGPAVLAATEQALAELKQFLAKQENRRP